MLELVVFLDSPRLLNPKPLAVDAVFEMTFPRTVGKTRWGEVESLESSPSVLLDAVGGANL